MQTERLRVDRAGQVILQHGVVLVPGWGRET